MSEEKILQGLHTFLHQNKLVFTLLSMSFLEFPHKKRNQGEIKMGRHEGGRQELGNVRLAVMACTRFQVANLKSKLPLALQSKTQTALRGLGT